MSRYRFIETLCDYYPVRLLCQLVAVPASGCYAWQQAQQQQVAQREPAWETALVKAFGVRKRCFACRTAPQELSHWAAASTNGHAPTGLACAAAQGFYTAHNRFHARAALRT